MKIRIYEEQQAVIAEADKVRQWGYEVDMPIDIVSRFRRSLSEFRAVQDIVLDYLNEAVAEEEDERGLLWDPVDENDPITRIYRQAGEAMRHAIDEEIEARIEALR